MNRWGYAIAGAAALSLMVHAARYYPFFADDALISLRYSVRFAEGLGLTWTNGEAVEGYSNPLWVLACALGIKAGFEPILFARLLGVGCGVGAVVAIARTNDGVPGLLSSVGAALCGPLAVWSIGGLEQPMVAAFLALALLLLLPRLDDGSLWPAGLAFAGLVLVRPDSPLFVAIAAVLLAIWRRGAVVALVVPPVVAWLGWEAFRLYYYRDWVPNTAYAKVAPSIGRFVDGLGWVGVGALWMAPLVLASFLAFRRWRSRRVQLLAALAVGWHLYVAWIGGDIFPAHRHWAPAVVLHALLAAEGLRALSPRWTAGIAASTLSILAVLSWLDTENRRAVDERWEWECKTVAEAVGGGFSLEQPLLGADPAGCWPYFSGLPAVDLFGLNDRWLAHHPPADLGKKWIGHGLGNGQYIYDRKPDLLVFCTPWGGSRGCGRSGKELLAMPAFKEDYRLLTFEGAHPSLVQSKIWTRVGGVLGPHPTKEGWWIPGYWLASDGNVARRDMVTIVVDITDHASVTLPIEGEYDVVAPGFTGTFADGRLDLRGNGRLKAVQLRSRSAGSEQPRE